MSKDPRIARTKEKIKLGFIELLKRTTFDKITVSDICRECKVHRISFYNHYHDKYDLTNEWVESFICSFCTSEEIKAITNMGDLFVKYKEVITTIVDKCYKNPIIIEKWLEPENAILYYMFTKASEKVFNCFYQKVIELDSRVFNNKLVIPFLVEGTIKLIFTGVSEGIDEEETLRTVYELINIFFTYVTK